MWVCLCFCYLPLHDQEPNNQTWHTGTFYAPEVFNLLPISWHHDVSQQSSNKGLKWAVLNTRALLFNNRTMSVLCNNSSYNLYLQKRFSGNQLAMGSNQPFLEFTHVEHLMIIISCQTAWAGGTVLKHGHVLLCIVVVRCLNKLLRHRIKSAVGMCVRLAE